MPYKLRSISYPKFIQEKLQQLVTKNCDFIKIVNFCDGFNSHKSKKIKSEKWS